MGAKWLQKLETFLIVTVITVLVWLYADVQNVREFDDQHVRVVLVPQPGQELAIEPSTPRDVTLKFRASNSQQARFRALNETLRREDRALEIEVDESAEGSADVASLLRRNPQLSNLGLNIGSADPAKLTVRVEPLLQTTLPVEVNTDGLEVNADAFNPANVTVTVPQSAADLAKTAVAVADMTTLNLTGIPVGVPQSRQVKLTLPPALQEKIDEFQRAHTKIEPASVTVTFTVQSQNETYRIPRVAVDYRISPLVLRRFDVDIPNDSMNLLDIVVTGPSREIERIRSGDVKIGALLPLTLSDIQNGEIKNNTLSVTPRLTDLPPGVVADPLKPIEMTIKAKE